MRVARIQIVLFVAVLFFSCCAWGGTFTAFGPQTYTRSTSQPVTVSNNFSVLNPNTQYTLHVQNTGISSAVISINGVQILGPTDFDSAPPTVDRPVTLQGNNKIDVQLRSSPGGKLVVSIIGIDNDPPVISVTAAPVKDAFGWNNTNVLVTFTCSDKTSGIATCPAAVTVSAEGANQVIKGTATDKAGNTASASVTINLDKTAPTISASPVPPANSFGWNNGLVTVTFNCADLLSGIATCTAPATLNAEGANQITAGTAVDRAGNIASTSIAINIDKTPPTITATRSPAPNAAGWNNTSVNVAFTCADSLSGIASCPPAAVINTEGANQNASGTALDKAGNGSAATVLLNIDKTPPVITAALVPAANSSGWNNSSVTVNFACSDALSGVAQCASPVTLTHEGAAQTANGSATDIAGNTASTSSTVNIDETPPTITASAAPAPNQNGWSNTDVTVSFTCNDLLSGVATCPGPLVTGSEGANQAISGAATDKAGNTATAKAILNIDKTPPVIAVSASQAPNAAGWNNSSVTLNFNCSDSLSGVDSCPTPITASTEGANQAFSGTALDRAGNSATASTTLNIDTTPPSLRITSPLNGSLVIVPTATLEGTVTDALSGVANVTCNGVAAQVSGASLTCGVPLNAGANVISIVATDVAGNSTTTTWTVNFSATPTITINSPTNLTVVNATPLVVTGNVSDPNAQVTVNGIPAPLSAGNFSVPVPLKEGGNTITAVAQSGAGTPGTATISISLDTTPPHVTIDSPPDGTVTTATTIAVSGLINDIVPGTVNSQQATVTVNGIPAQVLNRNYLLQAVPLSPGTNTITVVGTDLAGNSATASITVLQKTVVAQPSITLVSGDGQSGPIGTALASPLVVQLKDGAGKPVSLQPVVFKVTGSNGTLSGNPIAGDNGGPTLVVQSDANGRAQVNWTLGMRAGAGNNTVKATAAGFTGEVNFGAISLPATPGLISLDSGNNQTGAVGQALPHPFVVVVTDPGHNRLPNIRVTFTVKQGGGTFINQGIQTNPIPSQNSFTSIYVRTDSDGRAMAILTLGQEEGIHNNLVEANFDGNQGFPATFTASGQVAGDPAATSISGVALDNTNIPIAGITMQVDGTALTTQTDQQGQFLLTGVPVGKVKLIADGATAARPGAWPKLEYELVTVSGQKNTLGMPVYLLPLDLPHGLQVDETHGGTLTLPDVPGFSLTIAPGSVTFPDGGKSGLVSVTVVHADKVPMTPNFGQQPRFIISIQPAGAHFNPPAPMTLPNVDGLSPGEVTEMYSFDHDLGSFVAIGTGTVSKDGSVIKSDPGVGIVKGGWHCGGNPQLVGTTADCGDCEICQIDGCKPDPNRNGNQCGSAAVGPNSCKAPGICSAGSCGGVTNKPDGTSCDDGLFCTTNDNCTSGICTGQAVPDKPGSLSVAVNLNLKELTQSPVGKFLAFIDPQFGQEAEKLTFQLVGNVFNSEICCEATHAQDTATNGTITLQAGGSIEVPLAGPALLQRVVTNVAGRIPVFGQDIADFINRLVKLGIFLKAGGNAGGSINFLITNCQSRNLIDTGNFNLSIQAAVSGDANLLDGKVVSGSIALSSSATCTWIPHIINRSQISMENKPPCQWDGVLGSFTLKLFDGSLEIQPTLKIIDGGDLGNFSFVLPNVL